jgi:pentapeptide MXKDX repeat protein
MRKTILVTASVAALFAFSTIGASAQTGPPAQDSTKTNDTMSKDKMGKDGMMKKDGMETTGMKKDGMSKDMSKGGSPSAEPMKKDGMTK